MTQNHSLSVVIKKISLAQHGGFDYNPNYVDYLVRFGYKPTDTVYLLTLNSEIGDKNMFIGLNDLYELGQKINTRGNLRTHEDLVGYKVKAIISKDENVYTGPIERLEKLI